MDQAFKGRALQSTAHAESDSFINDHIVADGTLLSDSELSTMADSCDEDVPVKARLPRPRFHAVSLTKEECIKHAKAMTGCVDATSLRDAAQAEPQVTFDLHDSVESFAKEETSEEERVHNRRPSRPRLRTVSLIPEELCEVPESSDSEESSADEEVYRPRPQRRRLTAVSISTETDHDEFVEVCDGSQEDLVPSLSSFSTAAKECIQCKLPYTGFGAICSSCRCVGHRGSLLKCPQCSTFSYGPLTEPCGECGMVQVTTPNAARIRSKTFHNVLSDLPDARSRCETAPALLGDGAGPQVVVRLPA